MPEPIRQLLREIFNQDFTALESPATFSDTFFAHTLTLPELQKISAFVCAHSATISGKSIPAALHIPGKPQKAPYAILAQLHGNEPAGLAGIALAMALSNAGLLERDVLGVIGNPLAATQYFAALAQHPDARQETRDAYRCGLAPSGALLPDMNRIPVDFLSRAPDDHHTKRAQELYWIGQHISGIADLHSARGTMICITDHKHDSELKDSPIRAVLMELAEAISANASAQVRVQTLKTILGPLPNIESQVGIEAGTHEMPEAPGIAASFTLSLLHTLGITTVAPLYTAEDGIFDRYTVRPRITYGDLAQEGTLRPEDKIFMARLGKGEKPLLTLADGKAICAHQYQEMEAIAKDQIVAVAIPSGTLFKAPYDFSTLFISKSAALYDKDPAVGPWPVAADKIGSVKFCYPCDVTKWPIEFGS